MKGMVYKMDLKQLNELLDLALEQPEEVEHEEIHKNKLAAAIHASISEEEGAIAAYEKRAAKCRKHGNEEMAKMFQELADDEKVIFIESTSSISSKVSTISCCVFFSKRRDSYDFIFGWE